MQWVIWIGSIVMIQEVADNYKLNCLKWCTKKIKHKKQEKLGPTKIWTRIVRFRVWSANHYTIGPYTILNGISQLFSDRLKYEDLHLLKTKQK